MIAFALHIAFRRDDAIQLYIENYVYFYAYISTRDAVILGVFPIHILDLMCVESIISRGIIWLFFSLFLSFSVVCIVYKLLE